MCVNSFTPSCALVNRCLTQRTDQILSEPEASPSPPPMIPQHGSDSLESAQREIALWFRPEELAEYDLTSSVWTYERSEV